MYSFDLGRMARASTSPIYSERRRSFVICPFHSALVFYGLSVDAARRDGASWRRPVIEQARRVSGSPKRIHGGEARLRGALVHLEFTPAVAATQTKRTTIGSGMYLALHARPAVQIAMEARVLQDATGDGRFLLGLGTSKIFMKEIGEGERAKRSARRSSCARASRSSKPCSPAMRSTIDGKAFDASHPRCMAMPTCRAQACAHLWGATGPVLGASLAGSTGGLLTASITTPDFLRTPPPTWKMVRRSRQDP